MGLPWQDFLSALMRGRGSRIRISLLARAAQEIAILNKEVLAPKEVLLNQIVDLLQQQQPDPNPPLQHDVVSYLKAAISQNLEYLFNRHNFHLPPNLTFSEFTDQKLNNQHNVNETFGLLKDLVLFE